jgi:hypothetical protein
MEAYNVHSQLKKLEERGLAAAYLCRVFGLASPAKHPNQSLT